jgi:hypothetical protein
MRLRFLLPLLPILAAACSVITGSAADCVHAARVNDANYVLDQPTSADRAGAEFTRTLRQRGCDDVIVNGQQSEAWRNGDSSFPAGTPLYASLDGPTSEELVVHLPW